MESALMTRLMEAVLPSATVEPDDEDRTGSACEDVDVSDDPDSE